MNEDKIINCVDCKQDFILTVGEQEFFTAKQLALPKRCKECRIKKAQARLSQEQSQY